MSGLNDGCRGSTTATARMAAASSTRQKAMTFSVWENASSGAPRRPPRTRLIARGRMPSGPRGPACLGSNGCATNLRVLNAAMPRIPSQFRTNRRIGKLPLPGGRADSDARSALTLLGVDPIVPCMDAATRDVEPVVSLTPRAIEVVKQIRSKEGLPETHALRLSVVGGGCSGFSYQLDFDDEVRDGDQVTQYEGIRVLV